jgi:hypothetical protein
LIDGDPQALEGEGKKEVVEVAWIRMYLMKSQCSEEL